MQFSVLDSSPLKLSFKTAIRAPSPVPGYRTGFTLSDQILSKRVRDSHGTPVLKSAVVHRSATEWSFPQVRSAAFQTRLRTSGDRERRGRWPKSVRKDIMKGIQSLNCSACARREVAPHLRRIVNWNIPRRCPDSMISRGSASFIVRS